VLFIMGAMDQVVPYEQALRQCHEPVLAHIHTLEQSGHMGMLEEPESGSKFLNSFLNFVQSI